MKIPVKVIQNKKLFNILHTPFRPQIKMVDAVWKVQPIEFFFDKEPRLIIGLI